MSFNRRTQDTNQMTYFPQKVVMIQQQAPYTKMTFERNDNGYDLTIQRGPRIAQRKLTDFEYVKQVVDLKKDNFNIVEILQD